jgi:hypothetical protein
MQQRPGAKRDPGLEEVARAEPQRGELARRQVTAAVAQVAGHVAQDVRHLQGLAEPHAAGAHLGEVPAGQARPVRHVQRRPERAHAARHQVGVVIELIQRLEGGQGRRVLAGEAREVEDHARSQGVQHRAHLVPVRCRQLAQPGHRFGHLL